MLTEKERAELAWARVRFAADRAEALRQDFLWYLVIALAIFGPLMVVLGWHYANERAREKYEGMMIGVLVELGADPIKARCSVEKITDDNRQLCEKLVKE